MKFARGGVFSSVCQSFVNGTDTWDYYHPNKDSDIAVITSGGALGRTSERTVQQVAIFVCVLERTQQLEA